MICPTCGGARGRLVETYQAFVRYEEFTDGLRPVTQMIPVTQFVPCQTCGGCGVAHCCEGDQAQPVKLA